MVIKILFEADNKRSAAYDGDKLVGECTYSESDRIWVADHTGVLPEYGGQGIAKKLVTALVEAARENEKKIKPLCPFVVAEFQKNPDYADVLSN